VHVVVVGCGRVGSGLAMTLEEQGHTVAVIDRKPEAFRRLPEDFQGQRIQGVGFDQARLRQAGIERAEALAAVTNGDNSNIVVARVAREAFRVERVVARIYDQRRAAIYERVGIPTVATVQWTIERVLRRVLPDVSDVDWIDPSAQVALVERLVPGVWAGHQVNELEQAGLARLAALTRLGKAQVPASNLVVQEGDAIWMMVSGEGIDAFDHLLSAGPSKGSHG
jgi:trk system potassium uptake protein TrkA